MIPSSSTNVRPTKRRRTKAVRHVTEGDDELADGIIVKTIRKTTISGQVEETVEVPVWINEPAKAPTAEPSTTPAPMEPLENPVENDYETANEFYERDPESEDTPRTGRNQGYYIQQFVDRIHPMLKALLSREALPNDQICSCCSDNKIAIWRCKDCTAARLCCRGCIRHRHMDCPTHRVEVWNGMFFRHAELWETGLYVVVRHHADRDVCPALNFQMNTLEVFQIQKDADEEKRLREGVPVGMDSGRGIRMDTTGVHLSNEDHIYQDEIRLDSHKESMEQPSDMDIDDDEDFTEFDRRLDNMYKRSHDSNEKSANTKDFYEDDCDAIGNDIEEMPPLPLNYLPTASSVPITAAMHSETPDAPQRDALNNPYIRIIHTNGIHHIGVVYCTCRGMDNTHADLMAAGFVPTSFTRYRTFFTHAVLDDFRLSNLECKASAYQYFQKIRRQTSPMSPESVPNLYHELRRMSRLWRWMKKLKWAGLAHRPDFTIDPEPGELSNFCPACPQPGINIPEDWSSEPEG